MSYHDVFHYAVLCLLGVPFLLLEVAALRRYRGPRRLIALLAAMVVAWITAGVILDPAAHPLWPIDIILWLVPAVLVLLVLRVLEKRGSRSRSESGNGSG